MKKGNIKFISLIKDIRFNANMISLSNSFELLALFRTFGFRIINAIGFKARGYATRLNFLLKFFHYVLYMNKKHGSEFVVAFLKAGQLAISKKVANNRVKTLREINPDLPLPRLVNGLPSIIPVSDRVLIRSGCSSVIRYWLTLFSLYRIISIPGKLKLNTITDPFNGNLEELDKLSNVFEEFSTIWLKSIVKFPQFSEGSFSMISKASSLSDKSFKGFFEDLSVMPHDIHVALTSFLQSTNQTRILNYLEGFKAYAPILEALGKFKIHFKPFVDLCIKEGYGYPFGQLSRKLEAAGKLRVFAMVDYWTQVSLKGLHNYLFDILRQLPNDGTFDQQASVRRAAAKSIKANCSFGYDLSAATDRLPLTLQVAILSNLFSKEMANHWADLLVRKRDYFITDLDEQGSVQGVSKVRYAVGQPMGALSSWAMLALTHHLIVQYCYKIENPVNSGVWFDNYELLGDDIVIFDEKVAMRYLVIMGLLGVPINVSKSVVAKNATVEFAKVVTHNGVDVSALSWKLFLQDSSSLMGRANITDFLLNKGLGINNFKHYLKGLLRESKYSPGVLSPGFFALLSMLVNRKVFTTSWLIGLVNNPRNPLLSWYGTILVSLKENVLYHTLRDYWVKSIREFSLSPKMELLRDRKEAWLQVFLMGRVLMLQRKPIPSTLNQGKDYLDVTNINEKTLLYLLPNFSGYPDNIKRDIFDFFTMVLVTREIHNKILKWQEFNPRQAKTIDELLSAIELYESIESHFTVHLMDKTIDRKLSSDSPLRVLKHLVDLAKRVPPFVRDRSANQWFS